MYAFGCDYGWPAVNTVDVAKSILTQVVARVNDNQCFSQPSCNATDGLIYVIDWNAGMASAFDPQAGKLAEIAAPICQPHTVAIDANGAAWTLDNSDSNIKTLDLTDGTCGAPVGNPSGDTFLGMAFGPAGTLYRNDPSTGNFCVSSTTDGSFTAQGSLSPSTMGA